MKENKLVRWVKDFYPPLNLNEHASDITALVNEVLSLREKVESIEKNTGDTGYGYTYTHDPSFDLKKVRQGYPVRTKKSVPIELVNLDPIVGLVFEEGFGKTPTPFLFSDAGRSLHRAKDGSYYRLFMKSVTQTFWVNLYENDVIVHRTMESAKSVGAHPKLIAKGIEITVMI